MPPTPGDLVTPRRAWGHAAFVVLFVKQNDVVCSDLRILGDSRIGVDTKHALPQPQPASARAFHSADRAIPAKSQRACPEQDRCDRRIKTRVQSAHRARHSDSRHQVAKDPRSFSAGEKTPGARAMAQKSAEAGHGRGEDLRAEHAKVLRLEEYHIERGHTVLRSIAARAMDHENPPGQRERLAEMLR